MELEELWEKQIKWFSPVEKPKLNYYDLNFIAFAAGLRLPVTETQVINFYTDIVMEKDYKITTIYKNGVYQTGFVNYTDSEIRTYAIAWFDRNLGRALRRGILRGDFIKKLTGKIQDDGNNK